MKSSPASHAQVQSIRRQRKALEEIPVIEIEDVLSGLGIPKADLLPSGGRQKGAIRRERQGEDFVIAAAANDAHDLRFKVPDLDRAAGIPTGQQPALGFALRLY